MFAEDMHDFQLTFLDDNVKCVWIELDDVRILHIVINQQPVRQPRPELEADLTTKSQLECLDRVAVNLNERVVLCKHEFFLQLLSLGLLEDQFRQFRCVGRVDLWRDFRMLDVRHIFAGHVDVVWRRGRR